MKEKMNKKKIIEDKRGRINTDYIIGISIFILALSFIVLFVSFQIGTADCEEQVLFKNQAELKAFLANDTTDSHIYTSELFDCDDYTQTLINNASAEGYLLYFYVASYYIDGERKRHASCLAQTQDEGIFRIEPQTDWVGHLGWEL